MVRLRPPRADLEHGSGIFGELAARAWPALVALEIGRLGGRAPIGSALTTSERRVAERAATGRTNKEIAAELMISTRTVESQLSMVYRKLTVRSGANWPRSFVPSRRVASKEP